MVVFSAGFVSDDDGAAGYGAGTDKRFAQCGRNYGGERGNADSKRNNSKRPRCSGPIYGKSDCQRCCGISD